MILEIDAGNTAIKWRIVNGDGGTLAATQRVLLNDLEALEREVGDVEVKEARVSCVAGEQVRQGLAGWVENRWGVKPRFAKTQKEFAGLRVSYPDPQRLGVDRWLAMLAAYHHGDKGVCVIDCGSAITADLVMSDGRHRGGYIVPGVHLMKRAVLGDTRQIKMSGDQLACQTYWGQDTDEAVNFGIFRMAVAFIESILAELEQESEQFSVYVTGGDAENIRPMLMSETDMEIVWNSNLVLDGLAVALP